MSDLNASCIESELWLGFAKILSTFNFFRLDSSLFFWFGVCIENKVELRVGAGTKNMCKCNILMVKFIVSRKTFSLILYNF